MEKRSTERGTDGAANADDIEQVLESQIAFARRLGQQHAEAVERLLLGTPHAEIAWVRGEYEMAFHRHFEPGRPGIETATVPGPHSDADSGSGGVGD